MSSKKKLTIVILSFNTKEYLRGCLQSVNRQRDSTWDIVVVDNASVDDSVAMVRSEFPWVELIINSKNLGFAAGNNVALKQAQTPFLFLLNSDAELLPEFSLKLLLDRMDADSTIGVLTPKVVMENEHIDWACHRGIPTLWNALCYFLKLERLFFPIPGLNRAFGGYHQIWKDLSVTHDIDVCSGAAMLLRKDAIDKVGLLDERFFFYGEDVDWCFRFRQVGWRVVYEPRVEVRHYKKKSGIEAKEAFEQKSDVRLSSRAHFFATMIQFYKKHYQHRYPAFVVRFVELGVNIIAAIERSHLWPSARRT